jgi:hypothetical protein
MDACTRTDLRTCSIGTPKQMDFSLILFGQCMPAQEPKLFSGTLRSAADAYAPVSLEIDGDFVRVRRTPQVLMH